MSSPGQHDAKTFVYTVKDRCRVCYTCVRECPARAIKIQDGQAEIIPDCCICCGNCVRVCSQDAKQFVSTVNDVSEILNGEEPVALCLAPSFPAEFTEISHEALVAMSRRAGFTYVTEVGFGADIVAAKYRELLSTNTDKRYIATTCPAVVGMVERYHPELVGSLAPIASPMVVTARALKQKCGDDLKVVFVGPCISKKLEADSKHFDTAVDAVLTFPELRSLFADLGVAPSAEDSDDFDPPHAGQGALFPIGGGMLQAADIREDLMSGTVVSAEGLSEFSAAINDFSTGSLDAQLLEVLCCDGCIMGPATTSQEPKFHRRSRISKYARYRHARAQGSDYSEFEGLDASCAFQVNDQRNPTPSNEEIEVVLRSLGKYRTKDELNCGACGYHSCRAHAEAILRGRAEHEMCLPYAIDQMKKTVDELELSNEKLAGAQEALLQSEKLASMGQLAAGVAHEVNNPLGVVLMYSHILLEDKSIDPELREDVKMIAGQADRCKKIVANLLDFARQNKVLLEPTNLEDLLNRAVLSVPRPENIKANVNKVCECEEFELDDDQMLQVFTNMISNAYAAMPDGGTVEVGVDEKDSGIEFWIKDNGGGIPTEIQDKIFDPFFTTKAIGKGTGLGLAVTYGVVKMHRGKISLLSNADPAAGPTGTTFTIFLPESESVTI